MRYRFLEFQLDTEQQVLFGPSGPLSLRRQTFRVLLHLIERSPAVVSKDELLDAIWGHHAISPTAVAQTIRELRDALADDAQCPRVIATKHRVGYQFIALLSQEPSHVRGLEMELRSASEPARTDVRPPAPARRWPRLPVVAVMLVATIVTAALVRQYMSVPPPAGDWPRNEQARRLAQEAMQNARALRVAAAVQLLRQARRQEDLPRLALLQARMQLALGDPVAANEILTALEYMQPPPSRNDRRLARAITLEAAGRYADAVGEFRILRQIVPDDLDIGLALFELEIIERSRSAQDTYRELSVHPQLTAPRRLLMAAQTAVVLRDAEPGLQQAKAALVAAEISLPELAAMARVELARAQLMLGRFDAARDDLGKAADALAVAGMLRAAADAGLELVEPALAQGDLSAATRITDALTQRLDAVGDSYTMGRLLHARGRIALRAGRDDEAVAMFATAAEQHELGGNDDGVVSALGAQSGPLRRLGRADEAGRILIRALALAERSASAKVRASLHGNLGNHHGEDGRYDEAQRHFEAALALYRQTNDRRWEAIALSSLAELASRRGELRVAHDYHGQALAVFVELDAPLDIARVQYSLAQLALREGNLTVAASHADGAHAHLLALGHRPRLARIELVRAEIRMLAADLAGAEQTLVAAEQLADGDVPVAAEIAMMRGGIALLRGLPEDAREALQLARYGYEQAGQHTHAQAAQLELARADLMLGRAAAVEQEAGVLAAAAQAENRPGDAIGARLLRLESLLLQARMDEAEREAEDLRHQLERSPSFAALADWTRLRARLDLDRNDRRERLDWLLQQARLNGQHLLALRVQAERLADLSPAELAQWHAEVEQRGLVALQSAQLQIGR